jgi:hypothetical protein
MTEAEWLRCRNPFTLLAWVRQLADGRRWRLFNVACCRRVESLLNQPADMDCLRNMEHFADRTTPNPTPAVEALARVAYRTSLTAFPGRTAPPGTWWLVSDYLDGVGRVRAVRAVAACARMTAETCWESLVAYRYTQRWRNRDEERKREAREERFHERVARATLLRDIFGNPFRRVSIDPSWLTSTALALARGMYESRDFGAMPILADALQDAGCDNDDILDHCRGPGPHARGCWVVDLVLGKV